MDKRPSTGNGTYGQDTKQPERTPASPVLPLSPSQYEARLAFARDTLQGDTSPAMIEMLLRLQEQGGGPAASNGAQRDGSSDEDYTKEEGGDGLDDGDEEEGLQLDDACPGLFDAHVDISAQSCLQRAREQYGFDLETVARRLALDFYGKVRLVNWIRARVVELSGFSPAPSSLEALQQRAHDIMIQLESDSTLRALASDDALLIPVVPSDPLLSAIED
ncbi:hypothetical protein FVE85_0991 [Porphyridium purpureum]|uniref:Uncharacterized protein n=1 Tax=Porphyridium purpureum TaxID=35688 RepID=A0A5J4Z289_PORPP|nr:hypothetical protein FVE85_0991 [Porphyridium purpureum]|eukprot:POR9153..scf208_2